MRFRQHLIPLSCIIAAYFAIRLPWLFFVPMVEAPDEFSHYWVFKFLAQHMRLPTAAEVAGGGASGVYGSLPQLGYIPHVLLCKLVPYGDLSLVGRFGSLAMGLVSVVASYFLALEIFVDPLLVVALPSMILFHPQLVLVHAYANNDATTGALTTVILWLLVRALKSGLKTIKLAVGLGFLLGWTALSKYSGYAIFPTAIVAVLLSLYLHRTSIARSLALLSIMFVTFAATCGWWFYHSYVEYHGDVLGTKTMRDSWAKTYNRPMEFYMTPWQVVKQRAWWRMMMFSFWGLFGYMNKYLWRPLYFVYLGYMIIATIFGVKDFVKAIRSTNFKEFFSDRERLIKPAIWLTLALCCLSNIGAMVAASTINLGGPQGRYLFASEAPLMALLIAGVSKMGGKAGRIGVISMLVFNAVVCLWSFVMLWNRPEYHGFITKLY